MWRLMKLWMLMVVIITGGYCLVMVINGIRTLLTDKESLYPLILFFLSIPSFIYHLKTFRSKDQIAPQPILDIGYIYKPKPTNVFLIIFNFIFGMTLFGFLLFFLLYLNANGYLDRITRERAFENIFFLTLLILFLITGIVMAYESVLLYKQQYIQSKNKENHD